MNGIIYKFFKGFYFAVRGILWSFVERSVKIHFLFTTAVLVFGLALQISREEWFIVLILIAAVWSLELMNTAIEDICDRVRDELKLAYTATTRPRDLAAGSVLIMATIAALIGLIIFIPKIALKFGIII